jgi:hypothetical protein
LGNLGSPWLTGISDAVHQLRDECPKFITG